MFRNPNGPEHIWVSSRERNPANLYKVITAEIGYIGTIPFAIAETALAGVATVTSACLPTETHLKAITWLSSSAFAVEWAIVNACINPFCNDMVVQEDSARACLASDNVFHVRLP